MAARKAAGAVYTPDALAGLVVARTLATMPDPPAALLDPACGTGHFLVAAWRALRQRWTGGPPPVARLSGIERDPAAAAACRETLLACAERDRVELGARPAKPRILVADALSHECDEQEGRFDAVVGNPPYVRIDRLTPADRAALAARFGPWLAGKWDLYHCFLARSLEFLKPGGSLGFLTPNQYLLGRSAARLREQLATTAEIAEVVDLCGLEPFDRAIPPAAITVLSRRRPDPGHAVRISAVLPGQGRDAPPPDGRDVVAAIAEAPVATVTQARWQARPWSVLAPDPFLSWLDRLGAPRLGDVCPRMTEGDTRRAEEKAILPAALAPPDWWPAVRGRDVTAAGLAVPAGADRLPPPARPAGPRVLVRDVAPRLVAAPDTGGVRCLRTVYCLALSDAGQAAGLAALLNSDVLAWLYIRLFYSSKMSPRAANFRFQSQFLAELPILLPPPSAMGSGLAAWVRDAYRVPPDEYAGIRSLLARLRAV